MMRLRASDVSDSPTRCARVELSRPEPKLLTNRGPSKKLHPFGSTDGARMAFSSLRNEGLWSFISPWPWPLP